MFLPGTYRMFQGAAPTMQFFMFPSLVPRSTLSVPFLSYHHEYPPINPSRPDPSHRGYNRQDLREASQCENIIIITIIIITIVIIIIITIAIIIIIIIVIIIISQQETCITFGARQG